FQAEDGIRDLIVTGVQTCALPILRDASTKASRYFSKRRGPSAAQAHHNATHMKATSERKCARTYGFERSADAHQAGLRLPPARYPSTAFMIGTTVTKKRIVLTSTFAPGWSDRFSAMTGRKRFWS